MGRPPLPQYGALIHRVRTHSLLRVQDSHFVTKIYSHFQISIKFSFFISNIPYFKKEKIPQSENHFQTFGRKPIFAKKMPQNKLNLLFKIVLDICSRSKNTSTIVKLKNHRTLLSNVTPRHYFYFASTVHKELPEY
jgi:hypothetical protein